MASQTNFNVAPKSKGLHLVDVLQKKLLHLLRHHNHFLLRSDRAPLDLVSGCDTIHMLTITGLDLLFLSGYTITSEAAGGNLAESGVKASVLIRC